MRIAVSIAPTPTPSGTVDPTPSGTPGPTPTGTAGPTASPSATGSPTGTASPDPVPAPGAGCRVPVSRSVPWCSPAGRSSAPGRRCGRWPGGASFRPADRASGAAHG
ncbi:hypothetical protein Jiend_25030 [Micromonospora endophytica]|nr:hypothetical protein Jiend_25030 [Micromonospora endophytica]